MRFGYKIHMHIYTHTYMCVCVCVCVCVYVCVCVCACVYKCSEPNPEGTILQLDFLYILSVVKGIQILNYRFLAFVIICLCTLTTPLLLQYSAPAHKALVSMAALNNRGFAELSHSPYSADLVPVILPPVPPVQKYTHGKLFKDDK